MARNGLASLPLIKKIKDNSLIQKWYADDGNAVGKLKSLRRVLDNIIKHGEFFGYHVKASKCQHSVKDENNEEAIKVFKNTEIEIKKVARVLGFVIGSDTECETFLETQLEEHNKTLKKLGFEENVNSCYIKVAQEKLSILARSTPNTTENMQVCEKILQENLIPNLFGKENISHQFRDIASLPLKMEGLNIKLPSDYENSLEWSIKTSSVLDTYNLLTATPEQEKIYTKN